MLIHFTDPDETIIKTVSSGRDNHWDACLVGHEYLNHGVIPNAVDFIVDEGEYFLRHNLDANVTFATTST